MNNFNDLANCMFDQINVLKDKNLSKEQLAIEVQRSRAITDLGAKIIDIGKLSIEKEKIKNKYDYDASIDIDLLEG